MPRKPSKQQASRSFTYADYLTWPEDERWELIDGVAYDMTPSPSLTHQSISVDLCRQFSNFLLGKPCKVFHPPLDVRLPKDKEADSKISTVVQPDLFVVCDESKLDEKGCRGAPDLVIEILSPATASKDCIKKRELYERHGVKEYWIVRPSDRLIDVFLLGNNHRFEAPKVYDAHVPVTVLPGLVIDLATMFPSLPRIVRESPRKYLGKI